MHDGTLLQLHSYSPHWYSSKGGGRSVKEERDKYICNELVFVCLHVCMRNMSCVQYSKSDA